jgi:hypothetical protein
MRGKFATWQRIKMQNQTPSADAALAALEAKISVELPDLDRKLLSRQLDLEREHVCPTKAPKGDEQDVQTAAFALLNGSALLAQPLASLDLGVELYEILQKRKAISRAIEIAQKHSVTASVAVSREKLADNIEQLNAIERQRAICVATILSLNEKYTALRNSLLVGGIEPATPIPEFTLRLWGHNTTPSPLNHWPRTYLAACRAAGLISEKEIS